MAFLLVTITLMISEMIIVTSDNLIVDIKNYIFLLVRIVFLIFEIGISTSKKLIIDINN